MPRLWSQIAGALGLLTLAVLVLNAGVFWIVLEQGAVKRHTDLAWSLGGAMEAQLGAAVRSGADEDVLVDAVNAVGRTSLGLDTLVLMGPDLHPLVVVKGEAPKRMDVGLRAALLAKERHIEVDGSVFDSRRVVVTVPVVGAAKTVAILRIALPLDGPQIPGGPIGFTIFYVVACGGLIALFGWARLHRTMVVPIQRVQKGTQTIALGDFGHRLEKEKTVELQALVDSLNDMSDALAAYRHQTAEQVTSLEEANASLQRAQDALIRSERLAGVGRMAAGLAHEVGNPLAAVIAMVDLLHDGAVGAVDQGEMLGRARVELERIHTIIQSLLGYAHHGSGSPSRVDVQAALSAAVSTVEHQAVFQDKRIIIVGVEQTVHVWLEEDKLHQVVVNLLHNAADAPQSSEIRLRVVLNGDDEIEMNCEDDGLGFEPTSLERAFEPFFTTKDVGAGTGLGLSTCMVVIEQAGGTIDVFNRPESGACVRIRLPLLPS
jgi:two-component system NtrC family sensor kinase